MKTLYILVGNFSSSKSEEFFEDELPYLKCFFDKVVLVPLYKNNTELLKNSCGIEIVQFDAFSEVNRLKTLLQNFRTVAKVFIYELYKSHHKLYYLTNFKHVLSELLYRLNAAKRFEKILSPVQDATLYSYWFNQWALIAALIKERNSSIKIATRAHGSDYKEEQSGKVLIYRRFQLKELDTIICVSEYASKYLIQKFDCSKSKLFVNRLGMPIHNLIGPINREKLIILSCSSLIPLKRVHLIIDILKHINIPTEWHHFGDGILRESTIEESKNLESNIKTQFYGHVSNNIFINFLKCHPVSYFINVSEYEGIPVSIMEATSYGIPVIGTNVGGVNEIVTEVTGHLINVDFDSKEIAHYIMDNHKKGGIYKETYRQEIKLYSREKFSQEKNYSELGNHLVQLK